MLNPSLTSPEVAAVIDANWELVKRPGIVTFVVDTSGSMAGAKLEQAKDGLVRALDGMAKNNHSGLVAFGNAINTQVAVAPLAQNRFAIAEAALQVNAEGQTALYDAIKAGILMTDAAPGPADAIRGVVVLTDGKANRGQTWLDDLIRMTSLNEQAISEFRGFSGDSWAVEEGGRKVPKAQLTGARLAIETRHPIQIFFIGIGGDADLEVGRLLAEATGAEFQGVAENDLANVLAKFSKYF